MGPILSWLCGWIWESRIPSGSPQHDLLTAQVLIGPAPQAKAPEGTDLVIFAEDGVTAGAILDHLARLGTVGRVFVSGQSGLPLAERRHLSRVARQQRKHGIEVQFDPVAWI